MKNIHKILYLKLFSVLIVSCKKDDSTDPFSSNKSQYPNTSGLVKIVESYITDAIAIAEKANA